eukprot:6620322-Ditylum_brightwellii.AAC.1
MVGFDSVTCLWGKTRYVTSTSSNSPVPTWYLRHLYMGCPIIMSSDCTGKGELPPVGKGKSGR